MISSSSVGVETVLDPGKLCQPAGGFRVFVLEPLGVLEVGDAGQLRFLRVDCAGPAGAACGVILQIWWRALLRTPHIMEASQVLEGVVKAGRVEFRYQNGVFVLLGSYYGEQVLVYLRFFGSVSQRGHDLAQLRPIGYRYARPVIG